MILRFRLKVCISCKLCFACSWRKLSASYRPMAHTKAANYTSLLEPWVQGKGSPKKREKENKEIVDSGYRNELCLTYVPSGELVQHAKGRRGIRPELLSIHKIIEKRYDKSASHHEDIVPKNIYCLSSFLGYAQPSVCLKGLSFNIYMTSLRAIFSTYELPADLEVYSYCNHIPCFGVGC